MQICEIEFQFLYSWSIEINLIPKVMEPLILSKKTADATSKTTGCYLLEINRSNTDPMLQ